MRARGITVTAGLALECVAGLGTVVHTHMHSHCGLYASAANEDTVTSPVSRFTRPIRLVTLSMKMEPNTTWSAGLLAFADAGSRAMRSTRAGASLLAYFNCRWTRPVLVLLSM